jgi:hypothetical protein
MIRINRSIEIVMQKLYKLSHFFSLCQLPALTSGLGKRTLGPHYHGYS